MRNWNIILITRGFEFDAPLSSDFCGENNDDGRDEVKLVVTLSPSSSSLSVNIHKSFRVEGTASTLETRRVASVDEVIRVVCSGTDK